MSPNPLILVPFEKLRAFCARWGVKELGLFGSLARGDADEQSDADVMLEFLPGHGFTFENTPEIVDELEAIFGREVDVVEKGRVRNPIRRSAIMSSYKVLYAA